MRRALRTLTLLALLLALMIPGIVSAQDNKPYRAIRSQGEDSEWVVVDPTYKAKPGERMVTVSVEVGPRKHSTSVNRSVPAGSVKKAPPEPRDPR